MRTKFLDLNKSMERMILTLHDHIGRMEDGQLSNLMTAVMDMPERVQKMELALEKCQSEITAVLVEVFNLRMTNGIATKGR